MGRPLSPARKTGERRIARNLSVVASTVAGVAVLAISVAALWDDPPADDPVPQTLVPTPLSVPGVPGPSRVEWGPVTEALRAGDVSLARRHVAARVPPPATDPVSGSADLFEQACARIRQDRRDLRLDVGLGTLDLGPSEGTPSVGQIVSR